MTEIQKGYAARNRANAMLKLRNRNAVMTIPRQMPNQYQSQLRRATPQEVNYVDFAAANYNADSTGSLRLVATIAQGASVNQRIGKRAMYKSFLIRGLLKSGTTTTISDAGLMLVYDKRPTGALPLITDILTGASTQAFMNDNNTGRFQVIRRWDKTLIGNSTTPSTGMEAHNIDEYVKFKAPITFESAGTGAIGDIDMGAVYLLSFGNQLPGTTAGIFDLSVRTRFTEY
nr:MAG: capsid protein [Cressdnaviricota sp.]